jgi:predicted phosphodiesterase
VGKNHTIANQLVRDYLAEQPHCSSLMAARIMRKKHPALFATVEIARSIVRRVRGADGKMSRERCPEPMVRPPEEIAECKTWGALLPDSDDTGFQIHTIPTTASRYLIICDLHIPYHDKTALTVALQHAEGNCDGLLLLGDIVDAYQISSFLRDPRRRGFGKECEAVNRFLDSLEKLKLKQIIFKMGNHEVRLERYLMQRAPEIPDLCAEFSYRKQFRLDERGIMYIPPADPLRCGQLTIIHGHEWGNRFSSPVNQARGAFLKAHDCTLEGHGHRSSYHAETSLMGRVVRCWSVGCLCSLTPEYRPLGNKWDHGFAYLNTGTEWTIENHTIIDGKTF